MENHLTYLQVWRERVWQAHVARISRQYQVSHLNAVGRNNIAEPEMVITEEFRKIVQQHQQNTQRSLVEQSH